MQDLAKAGKYEILSRIGEGGFGVVYQGRDPFIKRMVAIKTCTSENEGTRRRFLREAEIAGRIVHPNITVVYDFGFEDGVPYLVQEFLSGEDLDTKIERGDPIPLVTKLDYLLQAAQGLGFAHELGITHRDIKPSNLRVLDDGRIKIMDFGIAKLASGQTQLTQTGTTLGTPAYLSPEQLRGDEVDARSDIYSFGALAYELLTYRRMFDAQTISTLFFQILHQAPAPLSQTQRSCPSELNELVTRCVAKDPEQRPRDFVEIILGLRQIIDALPTEAEPEVIPAEATIEFRPDSSLWSEQPVAAIAKAADQVEPRFSGGARDPESGARDEDDSEQSAELSSAVENVRRLTEGGQLDLADRALSAAREAFAEGPLLIAAGRQLRVQTKIFEARQALAEKRLKSAEIAAQRAQELDPEAVELPALLRSIDEALPPSHEVTSSVPVATSSASEATSEVTRLARPPARREPVEAPGIEVPIPEVPIPEVPIPEVPVPEVPIPEVPVPGEPNALLASSKARSALSTNQPPSRGIARSVTRRIPVLGIAAGVITLVLLIVVVAGVGRRWRLMAPGLGTITLDATPWAELISITDESGTELQTPENGTRRFTPIALELPPGRYRLKLAHPSRDLGPDQGSTNQGNTQQGNPPTRGEADGSRTVDIELLASGPTSQRVELVQVDAADYFRAIGLIGAPTGEGGR